MKKTCKAFAVLMALTFILSAFTVGAFAAQTKTDALFEKLNSGKEATVTFSSGDTMLGASTDKISIKGGVVAYDFSNGFFTARVVLKDNTAYAYLPMLPFFYVKVDNVGTGNMDIWTVIKRATGVTQAVLNYQKSYEEEFNGTTYYVEEYNDRATVTSKFYYLGDDLKILKVTDAKYGSVQYTYFEDISFSVSDSAVAVPTGFDVTPYLKFLFASFLTAALA